MEEIMIVANVAIIFGILYKTIELFVRRQERILLIEKVKLGEISNFNFENLFSKTTKSGNGALRLGCLMTGLGLGMLIGFFISQPYTNNGEYFNRNISNIYGSCVLLCGGSSLIICYLIEMYQFKKELKEKTSKP